MLTTKKIVKRVQNMKFFDSTLAINQEKVDAIKPAYNRQIERFEQELLISFKLKTIHTYYQLPNTYDILENPKQFITKSEFKRKVLDPKVCDEQGIITINTHSYKGTAFHMTEKEWDNYLKAYKELSK